MRFLSILLSNRFKLILLISSLLFPKIASADMWHANVNELKEGDVFKTNAFELHPAQFALGFAEVERQAKKLSGLSKTERHAKDEGDPIPVIIGPGNILFIIDGHHSVAAHLKVNHPKIFARVVKDWRDMKPRSFWESMISHNFVYLFDENAQGPLSPYDLPSRVDQMKNDPYRSLAGLVRRSGGYEKTGKPFEEFIWANYFRSIENSPAMQLEVSDPIARSKSFAAIAKGVRWIEVSRYSRTQSLSIMSCLNAFGDD